MIATLAFVVVASSGAQLTCPVMPKESVDLTKAAMEYKGMGFIVCCGGCDTSFAKDPASYLAKADKAPLPIAYTLFDPVTGKALSALKATKTMTSKGILYGFASDANLKAFKAKPSKYAAPAKDSLTDPISGKAIAKYSKAVGYVDYSGVRFYAENTADLAKMKASPAKVLKPKLSAAKAPTFIPAS
jgi:YHS domain-containing protein